MISAIRPRTSWAVIAYSLCLAHSAYSAETAESKKDDRYPFRTDFANADLPWYQPKNLEFPPHHSDRRISGELVSADFVHRKGQFRTSKTGELVDFTMPPYGAINYLNAEADLRDVPLGTFFLFFLNQDEEGRFTRLATMQDQFTMDASHGFSYRLDEVKSAENKLLTTKHSIPKKQEDLGKKELLITKETRFWKGDKLIALADLKPGDELLYTITGKTASSPCWCTDIWVGVETHQLTTDNQRKKFADFTKARGLPGWIEKTDGNMVTVTLFSGDSGSFKKTWTNELAVGKDIRACVANDELRTWNPPVDGERGSIHEVQSVPTNGYGCSGVRLVMRIGNMLEGFRKGRVVRLLGTGWKAQDQFYGESLMGYGFGKMQNQELVENPAKEYPEQFPFRTEFGNKELAWFKLQEGVFPPPFSEHVVLGELVRADVTNRGGQLRVNGTDELIDFSLIPEAKVRYLNATSVLADIPSGTRCRFHLYQDENGKFTKASQVSDEFSHMAGNVLTWRVESLRLDEGKVRVAWQIPQVKNYNGDMERPPDVGRSELRVTPETLVWKGDTQVDLKSLAVGDVLLANVKNEASGKPAFCKEIWIGEDTHKQVAEKQGKKLAVTTTKKK